MEKEKKPEVIHDRQWAMPVSFDDAGKPVSLRDYVSGARKARDFSTLDDDQRVDLAVKRIEFEEDYLLGSLGSGIIDQARAIKEIRAKTPVGRRLEQIEMSVVAHLLEVTKKEGDKDDKKEGDTP